jgi:hypothetical protein
MEKNFLTYFMLVLASCLALNGATSAVCGTEKYKNVKCTDVRVDYKGVHGVSPTASIRHTPCETAPGGPETTSYLKGKWEDHHVCVRTGTSFSIGPMSTNLGAATIPANAPEITILCTATENPFCKRVN